VLAYSENKEDNVEEPAFTFGGAIMEALNEKNPSIAAEAKEASKPKAVPVAKPTQK
jgi:hypothetical protein